MSSVTPPLLQSRHRVNRRNFVQSLAAGALSASVGSVVVKAQDTHLAEVPKAQGPTLDQLAFLERSFVLGREYYVLRSGRIQLIIQADRLDTLPAVLWMAFDARDSKQTVRKSNAYNFSDGEGLLRGALKVALGGFDFTALGHETQVCWRVVNGIPAVQARWWAGGFLVTELFYALQENGRFIRRITLESRNMGGAETVKCTLELPTQVSRQSSDWLVTEDARSCIAVSVVSGPAHAYDSQGAKVVLGPVQLFPGQLISWETVLCIGVVGDTSGVPKPFEYEAVHAATRMGWSATSKISSQDGVVTNLFQSSCFSLKGMIADDGTMDAGIFEYGGQWVRDTSNTVVGLLHAGHFELALSALMQMFSRMISEDGSTMISGGFDEPDREEFDEMGEVLHALRCYVDWTGDEDILYQLRSKILAVIERPLAKQFRHESGLIHGRREYWERTTGDGLESVYQFYIVLGLRCAVSFAGQLGAEQRVDGWRRTQQAIEETVLHDPRWSMIEEGRIIKRKTLTGERTREIHSYIAAPDVPMKTERVHLAEPDAGCALPIALGLIDPESIVARRTLDYLEGLWSARWFGGGYERYHSSAQPDQPGPWPFATCFLLRAQHDAGMFDRSRRTLEWLYEVQGGNSGAWFEEIPLIRSQAPHAGVLPWTSAELTLFMVRHLVGVRFESGQLIIKPSLYPNAGPLTANLRFRSAWLEIHVPGSGKMSFAIVNGRRVETDEKGSLVLPESFEGGLVVFLGPPN